MDKPNLILTGVPHSGTTIVAAMLNAMGWRYDETDSEYKKRYQYKWVVEANGALFMRKKEGAKKEMLHILNDIKKGMDTAKKPFVINDPRLIFVLDYWHFVCETYDAALLMIARPKEALARSYKRRGQYNSRGEPGKYQYNIRQMTRIANDAFDKWPGFKVKVNYNKICSAIKLFDIARKKASHPKSGKGGI